jgi:hypothetical protein
LVAFSGFTHVPGKRKAASPPDQQNPTKTFNIVAPYPVTTAALPDLMESTPPEACPPEESNNK